MYLDKSSGNNFFRTWYWQLCNEPFYYWQTGAPANETTIVSRLVTPEYFKRQCPIFFPEQDGLSFAGLGRRATGRSIDDVNKWTAGWFLNDTKRLLWVNG
jgi:hypothetical protein